MARTPKKRGPPGGFASVVETAIKAVRPHGPTPVLAIVLGTGGLAALAYGASTIGVLGIVIVAFGSHLFDQERRARRHDRDMEMRFDHALRNDGPPIHGMLRKRLARTRETEQPSLFQAEEDSGDD